MNRTVLALTNTLPVTIQHEGVGGRRAGPNLQVDGGSK